MSNSNITISSLIDAFNSHWDCPECCVQYTTYGMKRCLNCGADMSAVVTNVDKMSDTDGLKVTKELTGL